MPQGSRTVYLVIMLAQKKKKRFETLLWTPAKSWVLHWASVKRGGNQVVGFW